MNEEMKKELKRRAMSLRHKAAWHKNQSLKLEQDARKLEVQYAHIHPHATNTTKNEGKDVK